MPGMMLLMTCYQTWKKNDNPDFFNYRQIEVCKGDPRYDRQNNRSLNNWRSRYHYCCYGLVDLEKRKTFPNALMHDYHVNKVSAENKTAFCRLSGIGLIVIGIGLLISAVILFVTDSAYSFLCFAVCFVVGLAMLITAGAKYNR